MLAQRTTDASQVLNWQLHYIVPYPQNTSLNVNSEEATPGCWPSRQSSSVQCLCSFAHLNLFLASLRYGFFFATLPRSPSSRSHFFTVDVETSVLWVLFNEANTACQLTQCAIGTQERWLLVMGLCMPMQIFHYKSAVSSYKSHLQH